MKKFSKLYESFFSKEYISTSTRENDVDEISCAEEALIYKYCKDEEDGIILKFTANISGIEDIDEYSAEIESLIAKYCETFDWEKKESKDDAIEAQLGNLNVDVTIMIPSECEDDIDLELATEVKNLILNADLIEEE
jgi:hypothetical protein